MSLKLWLPFTKDLLNYGTASSNITATNVTANTNGKLGGCYYFNGSSYLIGTHNFLTNNIGDWSFACWMKLNALTAGALFSCRSNISANGITVFYYGSIWLLDDGVRWEFTPTNTIAKDTWYHVCFVRKKGIGKYLYINGVLDKSTTTTGTPTQISTTNYAIGGSQNSSTTVNTNYLNGYLNDVRFYDHALSIAEIKELAKGLVCHYKLDADGDTNLLPYSKVNSSNKTLLTNNIASSWDSLNITTIDGYQCYHYPSATSPTGWCSGKWFEPMEANTTYTYSAWIYFTANANFNFTSLGHFQVYNTASTASDKSHEDVVSARIFKPTSIVANKWTKIQITFTTNSLAGSYFLIYPRYNIAANTGDLYFRDCKLEKASKPTDWIPNFDDIEYSSLGYMSPSIIDSSGYNNHGIKGYINPYDTNFYTEPDGSVWIRIIHHNNPTGGLFSSSNTFASSVYIDSNRWFYASIMNQITNGQYELMIKQQLTTGATETKYRWIQTKNPYTAVFGDVDAADVTKITTSGYSTHANYGGIYKLNNNTYFVANNGVNGNWYCALGCWTAYQGGIPGYASTIVKSGYIDLYLRIDNHFSEWEFPYSIDTPRYNLCTNFDNSNSFIYITPYLSINQTITEISVSCWFKTNTLNGTSPNLWSLGQNSFFRLRLTAAPAIWYYARVGSTMIGDTVSTSTTLADNAWHHVLITFKNGIFNLYLDGVKIRTNDASSTATYLTCASVDRTWGIGGYTPTSEKYIGYLSDFRLYATALSANDVLELYNVGARIADTGTMMGRELKEGDG